MTVCRRSYARRGTPHRNRNRCNRTAACVRAAVEQLHRHGKSLVIYCRARSAQQTPVRVKRYL